MKVFKHLVLVLIVCTMMSCKPEIFFPVRDYYGESRVLKFNSDKSYIYYTRSEAYVKKFNRGTWRQEGKRLFLINGVSAGDELPFATKEFESNGNGIRVVVNIHPQKQIDWEQGITEVINIEMIADGKVYPIENTFSVINLNEHFRSAYFRAYPKPNSLHICEQLNDTLRTKSIEFLNAGKVDNGMLVDLDINPLYFAQVKINNDTLRIVNGDKIKWDKIYLERPR